MKIRVLQNFDCYERGQVFEDWPAGMAELLIFRGLIEEVRGVEEAAVEFSGERAEEPRPRKKR